MLVELRLYYIDALKLVEQLDLGLKITILTW